jgi:hypothetical protein
MLRPTLVSDDNEPKATGAGSYRNQTLGLSINRTVP